MAPYSKILSRCALIALVCGFSLSLRAEKLQFSTSGGQAPAKFEGDRKDLPQSNKSFEAPSAGFPSALVPTPQAPTVDTRRLEDDERKRNWIFARPEDSILSPEAALKVKGFERTNVLSDPKPTGFLSRYMDSSDPNKQDQNRKNSTIRKDDNDRSDSSLFSKKDNQSWERLWDTTGSDNRRGFGESPASMPDMWSQGRENNNSATDALLLQRALRDNDYKQMIDPRASINPLTALTEAPQQSANPILANQSDFNRPIRSINDQFTGTDLPAIGRSSAFDQVTGGANGNAQLFERATPEVRITPQPAVLPFPTRPGEVFKRPGSF